MGKKEIIVGNVADLEGLNRMNEVSNLNKKEKAAPKSVQQASLNAIDEAAEKLRSVISGKSDGTVILSFEAIRHSSARGGKRFMDIFEIRSVTSINSLPLFYPIIINDSVGINNENITKFCREYTFIEKDFPFKKLVVTHLIPCETIFAAPKETIVFLMTALIEHVLDSLNTQFVVYLKENATNFKACDFSEYLNLQTRTDIRWHDLITAMQIQFAKTFADYIIPLEYGDTVIANPEAYSDIRRNIADNLELRNIFWDKNIGGLLLTSTQAVRIEVMDEVYVHHRRVVHSASGENFHSLTAEVYYRFIPMLLPVPAIISTGLPDLRALQP